MRNIKLIILAILAILSVLGIQAHAQTATLTGTLTNVTSSGVGSNAYLKVDLYGCGGNRPIWSGGVITNLSTYYNTDSSGAIKAADGTSTATIIRNDAITCGNTTGSTTYYMQEFVDGQPAGPRLQFQINAATFNYNTAAALSVAPVVAAPTGDTVYIRRDGGNTVAGNILPDNNGTRSLGASGSAFVIVATTITASKVNGFFYVDGITYTSIQAAINALP